VQKLLSHIFRARPGEWGAILILQALIFLIIAVLLIVKPTASALFLSEYTAAGLPYMFILTALVAGVVATAYSYALRYYSLLRVMLASLLLCMLILLVCVHLMRFPTYRPGVAITLYLWVGIYGVLAASQFWTMANFVFDVRQAKRLFGLVGAGAIAGGITGGYLTNMLARPIGARYLVLLAAVLLILCLILTIMIWQRYVKTRGSKLSRRKSAAAKVAAPHKLIFNSRYLLLLCGIVAISVVGAKLVEFQFSALASQRFGDEDRLAAFFGFWYSGFNIIALLIQLTLTHRVVNLLGVSGALLFLPAGLGLGALVMLFLPGLGAATFSRAVDGSLKQSLSRASVEMLFLPVDEETKKRVKTYIDVFVDTVAGGFGGLMLIFLTKALGISAPTISWVVLIMVIFWLVLVLLIREEYMGAFREQLAHLQPKQDRNKLRNQHRNIIARFLKVLEDGKLSSHEKELLYVLERSEPLSDQDIEEPIRQLLQHPSAGIRTRVIRNLYLQPSTDFLNEIMDLTQDEDEGVRLAAFEYLFSRTDPGVAALGAPFLMMDSPDVAGNALVALVTEGAINPKIFEDWKVEEKLRAKIKELEAMRPGDRERWYPYLLRASSRSGFELGRIFIRQTLLLEDLDLVRKAIKAAGEANHEELIPPLLQLIIQPKLRKNVIDALEHYGGGFTAVLPDMIKSGELSIEQVRRLPSVLCRMDNRAAVELLLDLPRRYVPKDLETRWESIRGLNIIQRDFPHRNVPRWKIQYLLTTEVRRYDRLQQALALHLALLPHGHKESENGSRRGMINLLNQRLSGGFDRIMRLLGMVYPPIDIIPVQRALLHETKKVQLSGLEFLDNLLTINHKRLLMPTLELRQHLRQNNASSLRAKDERALRKEEFRVLRQLLQGGDERLVLASLHLIVQLADPNYLPMLTAKARNTKLSPRITSASRESLIKLREALLMQQD
jgi:AAA family ATP:ADP antiporter